MTHFDIQSNVRGHVSSLPSYYLVHTKPNCEAYATRFIEADAFNVYFPRVLSRRAHAGRVDYVPRPLFARYIFVRDDGRGPFFFRSAPGVSGVVTFSDEPSRVSQSVIDRIREREDENGFIQLDEVEMLPKAFRRGDQVRMVHSVLGGINAVFRCKLPGERASVFISLMGRTVRAVVDYDDLEHL